MKRNIDIQNKKYKVEACLKTSDMVVEHKTASTEKNSILKIILKFGGHFVNGNDVDMSYLRSITFNISHRYKYVLKSNK